MEKIIKRRESLVTVIIVAFTLLLGLSLRLTYVLVKPGITKDEANTLVFATGHSLSYNEMVAAGRAPLLVKATVADWRKFAEISDHKSFSFRDIFKDSSVDVHPPLFYEILYLWMLLTGSTLFGIRLLNVFIDLLAAVIFLKLAHDSLDRRFALVALFSYVVAPGFFLICGEVRSYALLGLWNVTAFWATWRIVHGADNWLWWMLWGLANVGGLYTHYSFSLIFIPLSLFVILFCLRRRDYSQLIQCGVSLFIVVVALIPLGLLFWTQKKVAVDIGWSGGWLGDKNLLAALTWAFSDIVFGAFRGILFTLPLGATAVIVAAILGITGYGVSKARAPEDRWLLGSLLFTTWIAYGGLYAVGFLPSHAIGAKYQVTTIPYFLIGLTFLMTKLKRSWLRLIYIIGLSSMMLMGSAHLIWKSSRSRDTIVSPFSLAKQVPQNSLVVLDNTFSGLVLPVALSLPPNQRILVASQRQLIRDVDLVHEVAGEKAVTYMSNLLYDPDAREEGRRQILIQLQKGIGMDSSAFLPVPVTTLGCGGCGRGFQVYVFHRQLAQY